MSARLRGRPWRLLSLGLAAGLLFAVAGDRGRAQSYDITGIDPLEVLELQLKPNVLVILDSSGSMESTLTRTCKDVTVQATWNTSQCPISTYPSPMLCPYITVNRCQETAYLSGDHPESKMGKAKQALKQIFSRNETKVSFAFASYVQAKQKVGWMASDSSLTTMSLPHTTGNRVFRYLYYTSDLVSAELQAIYPQADAVSDDVQVWGAQGDTNPRGLQTWQEMRPSVWGAGGSTGYFYFKEGTGTVECTPNPFGGADICRSTLSPVTASCAVSIATGFYRTGAALATELTNRINTCGNNTYTVTYDAGRGTFSFMRTVGGADFIIYWDPNDYAFCDATNPRCHEQWRSNKPPIGRALGGPSGTSASFVYNDIDGDGVPETKAITNPITTPTAWTLAHRKTATSAGGCASNDRQDDSCYAENAVVFYNLYASRFYNGQTIVVDQMGNTCDVLQPTATSTAVQPGADGVAGTADDTPVLWVRKVTSCGDSFGQDVPFLYAGIAGSDSRDTRNNSSGSSGPDGLIDLGVGFSSTPYAVNTTGCDGVQFRAELRPCDSGCLQYETQIAKWLEPEVPLTSDNELVPSLYSNGNPAVVRESSDGIYRDNTYVYTSTLQGGLLANGATPIAQSLRDIKTKFTGWWNTAGPADCATPAGTGLGTDPFSAHDQPAAPTIVVFVSDGNDTCESYNDETLDALVAARVAENLFAPVDAGADPGTASSVRTYMIAFGEGADPTLLNWIAWGGSGLGQSRTDLGMPDVPLTGTGTAERWNAGSGSRSAMNDTLLQLRAQCDTCTDALVARDGAELERQLQALIDQGATTGTFSAARQSITGSVYEYVWQASSPTNGTFDPADPATRFQALAPTRFISTFSLPGFRGEMWAVQAYDWDGNGDGVGIAWSAGLKLRDRVRNGSAGLGGTNACSEQCTFTDLVTNIDRRIYTTDGNGVYGPGAAAWASDPVQLAQTDGTVLGTVADRVTLWPPASAVSTGTFDDELGIPNDLDELKTVYGACVGEAGATLPTGCDPAVSPLPTQLQEARKEARQLVLAFMAGAEPIGARTEPRRDPSGNILYRSRTWVLSDSTQAAPALLVPPVKDQLNEGGLEYAVLNEGPVGAGATGTSDADRGCGLRNQESTAPPAMSVLLLPTNEMLHAFRAGPCVSGCSDTGGEELWGFVPYDQLPALRERFLNDPQERDNHVYAMARGVRIGDIFVKKSTTVSTLCGSGDSTAMEGVWRRVAYVARGAGGKFLTALDITSLGDYSTAAVNAPGPIPLWSRGNPDYVEATRERAGATYNHDSGDFDAYATLGETWSLPAVGRVDERFVPYDASPRDSSRPVVHALFMGSGYGDTSGCGGGGPCEGTTFYTLDALTGDVLAAADVGRRADLVPVVPDDPVRWDNALVASPAGYVPDAYRPLGSINRSWFTTTRVYIGDLHGRLWKFLTASPDIPVQVANLSTTIAPDNPAAAPAQPVATGAGLLGLPPGTSVSPAGEPYVYVTSGYDRRAMGPFKIFGFKDTGGDTDTQLGTPRDNPDQDDQAVAQYCEAPCNIRTYDGQAGSELLFARFFEEGDPLGSCTNPIEGNVFRGTVQPSTVFARCDPASPGCTGLLGRVFFGGTRLNPPGTQYAPPTPIACSSGQYPCRSSFDSIAYAVGAETGLAAYDLNASGDDAYRIYRDQRINAITVGADPSQGTGSTVMIDKGQLDGSAPEAPPPAGPPPNSIQSGSASVVLSRDPDFPPAAVSMSSTVCQ